MAKAKSVNKFERLSINMKNPNWMENLQNDNIITDVSIIDLKQATGIPALQRVSKAIVSNDKIIHVASNQYGLLKNEDFFLELERKLIDADIQYVTRSINKSDSSFLVDYILTDDRYKVNVKTGGDELVPMMRAINSYDGSSNAIALLGFYRKVCENGLTVSDVKVNFQFRHTQNIMEVVIPNLDNLIMNFIDNQYYSLHKKFQVLAETPIKDLEHFVEFIAKEGRVFKTRTDKDEMTKTAQDVLDIILAESETLGVEPSLWLGYNAFNEHINNAPKAFSTKYKLDGKIFQMVSEYQN